MASFCNFCGTNCKNNVGISQNTFIYDDQTVIIEDLLKVLRNDIVELFAFDPSCSICCECLDQLKNCYIFVKKIEETASHLKLSSYKHDIKIEPTVINEVDDTNDEDNYEESFYDSEKEQSPSAESKSTLKPLLPKISGKSKPLKISIKSAAVKSPRLYKCLECTQAFKSFKHLREHETGSCPNTNIAGICVCQYCHLCFKESKNMMQHQFLKHPEQQFVCCLCPEKLFTSKGFLARHIHTFHDHPFLQFFCGECEVVLQLHSQDEVKEHFSKIHPLASTNDNSGNEKSPEEEDMELEMHEEFLDEFLLAHTNENSFQFSECWEALDLHLPDMLQGHSSNFHNSEELSEAFPCPKCFEQFKNPQPLLKHLAEIHNLPVLICRKCRKPFTSIKDFKTHKANKCEERSLADMVSIPCPYCSKTFTTSLSLKQHLRIVHTRCKKHICQLCDKQFSTLDHLKKHVLSQHQNERKHNCPTCAKSFTQLCHLKQHMAIHTTGKTIQCTECLEKFWRNIDMLRHRSKTHAGF